eukprot:gene19375-21877_t
MTEAGFVDDAEAAIAAAARIAPFTSLADAAAAQLPRPLRAAGGSARCLLPNGSAAPGGVAAAYGYPFNASCGDRGPLGGADAAADNAAVYVRSPE